MKLEKTQKYAFSLAEALITLLIVCLITLASIPILTKKKRTVPDSASGQWICTKVAQKDDNGNITGYKHVYYNSQTSSGDINDPTTWEVSGDGTSCEFVPPLNAKNFGVTVIGGGGGGADGLSKREIYMNVTDGNTETLSNLKGGVYRLALAGNGGGGSGSDDSDGCPNCGIGGQGGSGGYWFGEITLQDNRVYSGSVASYNTSSTPVSDGDKKCKHGYNKDRYWTSFNIDGDYIVKAGSGQSGKSTRNRGGKDPDCGSGGVYGSVNINPTYQSMVKEFAKGGKSGRLNENQRRSHNDIFKGYSYRIVGNQEITQNQYYGYTDTGAYIPKEFWGGDTQYYIGGDGGYGARYNYSKGLYGKPGRVVLWQILQQPGLGGKAAPLNTTVIANIKGKLVATIGTGGAPGADGAVTIAEIYDKQGNVARTLTGPGGEKGELGEAIASNTGYANGEPGKNSLWDDKGGGTYGTCSAAGFEQRTYDCSETVETDECEVGYYIVGSVDTSPLDTNDRKISCTNGYENTGFPCVGYVHPKSTDSTVNDEANSDFSAFVNSTLNGGEYTSMSALNAALGTYKFTESFYINASNILSNKYPMNEELQCEKYKTKTENRICTKLEYVDTPHCTPAGDGTIYGSGGGGGGTSNILNLAGKGGYGAPGAVIVEW